MKKKNFLKSVMALILCAVTVLAPTVNAVAADMPTLNLGENGSYTAPAENAPEMIEKEYFISDLPDGFKMTEYKRNILFVSQTFTKEDKYICFNQSISNAYVCNIDNEYGSSERYTDENGQTYLIYDFNDECMIMWKVEGYVLSISGNIDKDSLLDLCKSTKCK